MNQLAKQVLAILSQKGPMTVPQIGAYVSGTRSEIARAVLELGEAGFLEKKAQVHSHGGLYCWCITEKGKQTLKENS